MGVVAKQRMFRDGSRQMLVEEGFASAIDRIDKTKDVGSFRD